MHRIDTVAKIVALIMCVFSVVHRYDAISLRHWRESVWTWYPFVDSFSNTDRRRVIMRPMGVLMSI